MKKIWKKGDKITSAALNRIEDALDALANASTLLDVQGTFGTNPQTGKVIVTLDITAGELYEAVCAGKAIAMTSESKPGESIKAVFFCCAVEIGSDRYMFTALADKEYNSDSLSANDPVVLTEV